MVSVDLMFLIALHHQTSHNLNSKTFKHRHILDYRGCVFLIYLDYIFSEVSTYRSMLLFLGIKLAYYSLAALKRMIDYANYSFVAPNRRVELIYYSYATFKRRVEQTYYSFAVSKRRVELIYTIATLSNPPSFTLRNL